MKAGMGAVWLLVALLLYCMWAPAGVEAKATCLCDCCYHAKCLDLNNATFEVDTCSGCSRGTCIEKFFECQDSSASVVTHNCLEGDNLLNKIFVIVIITMIVILITLATMLEWFPHKFPWLDTFFRQT